MKKYRITFPEELREKKTYVPKVLEKEFLTLKEAKEWRDKISDFRANYTQSLPYYPELEEVKN